MVEVVFLWVVGFLLFMVIWIQCHMKELGIFHCISQFEMVF